MRLIILLLSTLATTLHIEAQTATTFKIDKHKSINLSQIKGKWNTTLTNLEAPSPGGESYRDYLSVIKKQQEPKLDHKKISNRDLPVEISDTMPIIRSFEGNIGGGRPNDLTLAISNEGKIMSCMNSNIYFFEEDGAQISNLSLVDFADSLNLPETRMFDPKVKYHPDWDRFIFCFLHSSTAQNNRIVFGFSQTNDPSKDWNVYLIPGHHIDTTWWSDYPALGLTQDEAYLTLNYIQEGVSWQEGFRGSIIWQMDLEDGFNGEGLSAKLWEDITFEGKLIRNLHPVSGGSKPFGPNMYFLSNKNFSLSSDSIFLVELTGKYNDASTQLKVRHLTASQPYGVPPEAYQAKQTYSGNWHRFATNDSRVLGGFYQNNKIQFVGNCLNFKDSTATFYHGFIDKIEDENPICHLKIFDEDTIEYGYPNIAFAGTQSANDAIINFMHSSKTVYSGYSSIFYKESYYYSPRQTIKQGNSYVNLISGTYERWGDYSGIQRKYNEPGVIWMNGSFGKMDSSGIVSERVNGTWIASLSSPDTALSFIEQNSLEQTFLSAYPNPVLNYINIEFEMPFTSLGSIELYNQNGQLVKTLYQDKIKAGRNLLTFSNFHLERGIYFVKINVQGQSIIAKRIVKQ